MNFFQRFFGVFFNANSTFKALSEKPSWVDAFIFLLMVLVIFSYLKAPYQTKDALELMRSNIKLQERMGEERFNQMIERMENPSPKRRILGALIQTPITSVIGFLLSTGILFGFSRIFSSQGNFKSLFSAFLHA